MTLPNPLKVLFFIPNLNGGGAERIVLTYLCNLDRKLFKPVLVLCEKKGVYLDSIPPDVEVYSLERRSRFSFPLLIFRFSKLVTKLRPHFIVSFLWYADVIQLLARKHGGPITIASIHTVPDAIQLERYGYLKTWMTKRIYARSDYIFTVSQAVADRISTYMRGGNDGNISVQYNPFPLEEIRKKANEIDVKWPVVPGCRLISVGRLEYIKGFDLLIEAASELPSELDWHLKILGTGSLEADLLELCNMLGLQDRISFEGFVENPYGYVSSADVLVLSSRFEAFPSVLVEALALGTCVVAFDCPSGPGEIINHNFNGILVEPGDPYKLASAIQSLLEHQSDRESLSSHGPETVSHMESQTVMESFQKRLISVFQERSDHNFQ